MEEFSGYSLDGQRDSSYDSVVMGLSPSHFNYDTLTTAFRILSSSPSKPLITTHRAKYIRTKDGELSLGPGPFVRALEEAVGQGFTAEAIGKPNKAFFERVIASMRDSNSKGLGNLEGKDVAVIGDDIEADLGGGAVEMGLWRVLGMNLAAHLRFEPGGR